MKSVLLMLSLVSACMGLQVNYRSKVKSVSGRETWNFKHNVEDINPARHAVVVVDMWNEHWCPSATSRVKALAGPMNSTVALMRSLGFTIIWAPSQCDAFYNGTAVRARTEALPDVEVPVAHYREVEEFPISSETNGGCDVAGAKQADVWYRQIETLDIDQQQDFLITSKNGTAQQEMFNIIAAKGITGLTYIGVHENMCIMNRNFAIEEMTARGFRPNQLSVIRELVDVMYTPYDAPYVPHAEGVKMQTEYIEQFWGRSFSVYDILTPSYNLTA